MNLMLFNFYMEKVCIIILTAIILLTLWTNDIYLTIFDILISIIVFIISYNLNFYFGKYLQVRRERKNFELIIKALEKCTERQKNTQ